MTSDRLKSSFAKYFYGDTADVISITYGDDTGYDRTEKAEKLCTVKCDLQPYSGELAQERYGIRVECQKRLYTANNDCIKAGNYIDANGERFRIEYAEHRQLGTVAFLKKEV